MFVFLKILTIWATVFPETPLLVCMVQPGTEEKSRRGASGRVGEARERLRAGLKRRRKKGGFGEVGNVATKLLSGQSLVPWCTRLKCLDCNALLDS